MSIQMWEADLQQRLLKRSMSLRLSTKRILTFRSTQSNLSNKKNQFNEIIIRSASMT